MRCPRCGWAREGTFVRCHFQVGESSHELQLCQDCAKSAEFTLFKWFHQVAIELHEEEIVK